jgi:hypothetical protein
MRLLVSIAVMILLLAGSIRLPHVTAQESSLLDLLPAAVEIGPSFVVIDTRLRTLDEQATGFADASEAARLLADWAWQGNAFAVFQSTTLTPSGAPAATLDISLTQFATGQNAAEAMPYFLLDRAAVLGQREVSQASQIPIGDEARAVSGAVDGGSDDTLYVRSGTFLMRISLTTAAGTPATSPQQIARGIIERTWAQAQTAVVAQPAGYLPEILPVAEAECFRVAGQGPLAIPGVIERLAGSANATATLEALGWVDGAYRQFACDPQPGGTGWVDLSVHHFADADSAAEAVTVFAESRARATDLQPAKVIPVGDTRAAIAGPAVNGTEYTLYLSSGALLFAVTGVAPDGDPTPDVETIAQVLDERSRISQVNESPTPLPTAQVIIATTAPPIATPTATMPTAPIPVPTATPRPLPTFTPIPVPTATFMPTVPIATATEVPAALSPPLPTAPAGAPPTPTPRVIRPPTPVSG